MRLAWPLLSTALLVLAVVQRPASSDAISLVCEQVPLDPADPARRAVGGLRYEGGLVVRGSDVRLGGLSSFRVRSDGGSLVAVSDCGEVFSADLRRDSEGRLSGLGGARFFPLIDERGRSLSAEDRDAEGLTYETSGAILISFERRHRIWRYPPNEPPCGVPPLEVAGPTALARLPYNSGLETVVRLSDGRILLVAEGESSCPASSPAWIGRDGAWEEQAFPLFCEEGMRGSPFRPTDAALLPNGDVVVLERRFPPLGARLRRISLADLSRGDLTGHQIALLEPPLQLDNFEGVDVWRTPNGETRLLLISDDNNCRKSAVAVPSAQRTLLFEFSYLD
jgi:hypothetical protein